MIRLGFVAVVLLAGTALSAPPAGGTPLMHWLLPGPSDPQRWLGASLRDRLLQDSPELSTIRITRVSNRVLGGSGSSFSATRQVWEIVGQHAVSPRRTLVFGGLRTADQSMNSAPVGDVLDLRLQGDGTSLHGGVVHRAFPGLNLGLQVSNLWQGDRSELGWEFAANWRVRRWIEVGGSASDNPALENLSLRLGDDVLNLGNRDRSRAYSLWTTLGTGGVTVHAGYDRAGITTSGTPSEAAMTNTGDDELLGVNAGWSTRVGTLGVEFVRMESFRDSGLLSEGERFSRSRHRLRRSNGVLRYSPDLTGAWGLSVRGLGWKVSAELPGVRLKSWPFESLDALSFLGGRSWFAAGEGALQGLGLGGTVHKRSGLLSGVRLGVEASSLSGAGTLMSQFRDQGNLFGAFNAERTETRVDEIDGYLVVVDVGWHYQMGRSRFELDLSQLVPVGVRVAGSVRHADGTTESIEWGQEDISGSMNPLDGLQARLTYVVRL